uniref:Ig-like domain-containing protein n=1 Tax=Denticeps clupeoides TaxID=299321 RepID=A0AAY4EKP8_9TELE
MCAIEGMSSTATCVLTMLMFASTAASTEFIVTQWPAMVRVDSGQSITLKCYVAELYTTCATVTWLKTDPIRPQSLNMTKRLQHTDDPRQSTYGWSKDCSASISSAQVEDSGMYYCVVAQGHFALVGNGSLVTVTSENFLIVFPGHCSAVWWIYSSIGLTAISILLIFLATVGILHCKSKKSMQEGIIRNDFYYDHDTAET